MAVENVNEPPRTQVIDPKHSEKKDEGTAYWETAVKNTRLQREFKTEKKLMEELENPPAPPQEPSFKVTGGVNLGTIDLQEQQRLAREETAKAQEEGRKRVEKAETAAQESRDALAAAQLTHLRENLSGQIAALQNAISSGQRGDIVSELDNIEKVAARLGLGRTDGGGIDLNTTLALKKLEQEMKREDRRFALEMKKDERLWQIELKRLESEDKDRQARAEAERGKYAMIASLPEQLGGVIARGLTARADDIAAQPKPARARAIQAGEGEAGEIECPVCQSPVGIGPTAEHATCAGCGQGFDIRRTAEVSSEA